MSPPLGRSVAARGTKCRRRNTSHSMILVLLLSPTLGRPACSKRGPSVRDATLVFRLRHLVPLAAPDRPSVGDIGNTSNSMILVLLLSPTLGRPPCSKRGPSVRAATLVLRHNSRLRSRSGTDFRRPRCSPRASRTADGPQRSPRHRNTRMLRDRGWMTSRVPTSRARTGGAHGVLP